MRERDIEKSVCRWAEKNGWLAYKWTSPQNRGVPDRLFIKDGRVVAIEFKAPGRRPTPSQELVHDILRDAGLEVHVADSVEAGRLALERVPEPRR